MSWYHMCCDTRMTVLYISLRYTTVYFPSIFLWFGINIHDILQCWSLLKPGFNPEIILVSLRKIKLIIHFKTGPYLCCFHIISKVLHWQKCHPCDTCNTRVSRVWHPCEWEEKCHTCDMHVVTHVSHVSHTCDICV